MTACKLQADRTSQSVTHKMARQYAKSIQQGRGFIRHVGDAVAFRQV
jgi:hypothetical protein